MKPIAFFLLGTFLAVVLYYAVRYLQGLLNLKDSSIKLLSLLPSAVALGYLVTRAGVELSPGECTAILLAAALLNIAIRWVECRKGI